LSSSTVYVLRLVGSWSRVQLYVMGKVIMLVVCGVRGKEVGPRLVIKLVVHSRIGWVVGVGVLYGRMVGRVLNEPRGRY